MACVREMTACGWPVTALKPSCSTNTCSYIHIHAVYMLCNTTHTTGTCMQPSYIYIYKYMTSWLQCYSIIIIIIMASYSIRHIPYFHLGIAAIGLLALGWKGGAYWYTPQHTVLPKPSAMQSYPGLNRELFHGWVTGSKDS